MDEFPQQRLAVATHGARWVRYHPSTARLMVWRGGDKIDVIDVETAQVRGNWLCDGTLVSAQTAIEEHLNKGH
jgi:hypothetical protein